jgi:hypothetical protein
MQLRPAGSWAHKKIGAYVPRRDGATGSIGLGIFDEPERGRTKVSQTRSRVRMPRPSWPLSARLLVGAMFVLNIFLAASLVRTEFERPGAPTISTPLAPDRPKAGSALQINAPPDQGPSLDRRFSLGLKTPPVEARPAAMPNTQKAKRPETHARRASKPQRAALSAPMPQPVIYPPQERFGRTPSPVRNPGARSSASANVAPQGLGASHGLGASFGIPGAGVHTNAGPHPNAPASPALAPLAMDNGVTAKGTGSGSMAKVAPVRLQAMEKGLAIPKMPVAPVVLPKMEIRPAEKPENCGDDKVFVACPTLKIRYDTPYTSPDR